MRTTSDPRPAVEVIRARTALVPEVGIILCTGLGALVREIASPVRIPYADLPGFARPTVESHAALIRGVLARMSFAC